MPKILFVDDDPQELAQLRMQLEPMRPEWDMTFVPSGQQALAHLANTPCDVVVTDMLMPGMAGDRLLAEVRTRHPHIVRIILSSHANPEMMRRTADVAHQHLPKASTLDMLKGSITRACVVRNLLADEALRKLVSGMQTLPSLPTLYQDLMKLLYSDEASIDQVARIISKDMGMVTKILQVVNSPYYGLRGHVSNPTQAVALLGFNNIKSLVLTTKVFAQFDQARLPFFSLDTLWQHGMVTGSHARAIAKEEGVGPILIEDTFTAGLLHDVGILIIATNLPERYTEMLALMQDQHLTECAAERELFGATHAEVGGCLLGIWGLSDAIVEAVAFHHDPSRCVTPGFSALAAVHVANVTEETQQALAIGDPPVGVDMDYLAACGLADRLPLWQALCHTEIFTHQDS